MQKFLNVTVNDCLFPTKPVFQDLKCNCIMVSSEGKTMYRLLGLALQQGHQICEFRHNGQVRVMNSNWKLIPKTGPLQDITWKLKFNFGNFTSMGLLDTLVRLSAFASRTGQQVHQISPLLTHEISSQNRGNQLQHWCHLKVQYHLRLWAHTPPEPHPNLPTFCQILPWRIQA